jgi:hypothetical protein
MADQNPTARSDVDTSGNCCRTKAKKESVLERALISRLGRAVLESGTGA